MTAVERTNFCVLKSVAFFAHLGIEVPSNKQFAYEKAFSVDDFPYGRMHGFCPARDKMSALWGVMFQFID